MLDVVFFFQAEDGIRDLVRSRGLGDVYKRQAMHHPFTCPMDEDIDFLESDQGRVRSKAYDIVLNGCELGGGSIRIHNRDLQMRIFKLLGFSEESAQEQFGFLLDSLLYTSNDADDLLCVDLGGRRTVKKKKHTHPTIYTM